PATQVSLPTEPAGGEAVHGDSVFAPVVGEAHGELPDSSAAGSVGSETCVAGDAGNRSDVDDAAVVASNHAAGDRLSDEKTAAKIGVENLIPIIPAYVQRR